MARHYRYTPACRGKLHQEIRDSAATGMSRSLISKKIGCTATTVRNVLEGKKPASEKRLKRGAKSSNEMKRIELFSQLDSIVESVAQNGLVVTGKTFKVSMEPLGILLHVTGHRVLTKAMHFGKWPRIVETWKESWRKYQESRGKAAAVSEISVPPSAAAEGLRETLAKVPSEKDLSRLIADGIIAVLNEQKSTIRAQQGTVDTTYGELKWWRSMAVLFDAMYKKEKEDRQRLLKLHNEQVNAGRLGPISKEQLEDLL